MFCNIILKFFNLCLNLLVRRVILNDKIIFQHFFVAFFVAFSTKKATNYFNLYNLPFVLPLSMSLSSAINSFNNSFVLVSFNPRLSAISAVLCHSPSFYNFKIFSYCSIFFFDDFFVAFS